MGNADQLFRVQVVYMIHVLVLVVVLDSIIATPREIAERGTNVVGGCPGGRQLSASSSQRVRLNAPTMLRLK